MAEEVGVSTTIPRSLGAPVVGHVRAFRVRKLKVQIEWLASFVAGILYFREIQLAWRWLECQRHEREEQQRVDLAIVKGKYLLAANAPSYLKYPQQR